MPPPLEKLLFFAASNLAARERRMFLDHACRDDPGMRKRLDELLELQAGAEEFFAFQPGLEDSDSPEKSPPEEAIGADTRIGRYRLIERIGEGGCGVVYLAEQQEPVRRQVALKIIRPGMDTERMIARFAQERQALALMDHPNIARVFDAGATATGRPFFVMERVDGEKITGFCDANRLDVRKRLRLFVQICQAIQHAHQKGVIHRDIKPSNVLVALHDGIPVPKVIDFGIAKAAAAGTGDDGTFTAFDQFSGTPAYMSPEQTEGGMDVDTRSDIYSLGVLLYELLSGRPPFDPKLLKERGVEEVRRILRLEEPPSPAAAFGAAGSERGEIAGRRDTDSHRLLSQLGGDLEWIVMKAMSKDRRRRYDTANGLAMDVIRYLNDDSVSARPPSRGYRLKKLILRNKVAFAAGSVAAFGLLAGFGIAMWLFLRETEARKEQARLRAVAENARTNEASLREGAELRERIAQAAVRINYGDLKNADELLASVPLERTPSSLEAANALRRVAQWHLSEGRWDKGAERFASLANATANVDASDSTRVSRDFLPAAAVVCLAGGDEQYEQLRRLLLRRFGNTTQPVVGEHILKSCLLRPAEKADLRQLAPLGEMVEKALNTKGNEISNSPHMVAWSCFALALLHYRSGDDPNARIWATRCLAYPKPTAALPVSGRIILALIEERAGQRERAAELRKTCGEAVDRKFAEKLRFEEPGSPPDGYWHDWVNARVLLEEARRNAGE